MLSKKADLLYLITTYHPDIIIVGTETWLTNSIRDNEIIRKEYNVSLEYLHMALCKLEVLIINKNAIILIVTT